MNPCFGAKWWMYFRSNEERVEGNGNSDGGKSKAREGSEETRHRGKQKKTKG